MNDYKIKELYEQMELELISSMKRNYNRHLKEETKTGFKYTQWQAEKLKELKRYRTQNKEIIGDYTNTLNKEISKHMQEELRQGSINSIKQYNKILGKKLKPSKIMNKSFFRTNDRKVNALIKVVNNDLKTANTAVLRMANDQYRQVIHKSAFFVGNGVFTEQQATRLATDEISQVNLTKLAIDEANKDFLSRGFNCIQYANGRRVNVASYAQMAVRTANLRAQLMGEGDFRKSIGRTLVQATSHGGACPICQKWEKHIFIDDVYSGGTKEDGKYMLLSEAMAQGFLHPNCRHGLTTYYPELEDAENESEEEYQENWDYINERMNYIERNIKKYDRLETGSLFSENIKNYSNLKQNWEKEHKVIGIVENVREIMTPEFQNRVAGVKIKRTDKNFSYFINDDNKVYLGNNANEYTLIHELGHKLQYNFTEKEQQTFENIVLNKFQNYTKKDFIMKKTKTGKYWVLKDYSNFVSQYQTRIYNGGFNAFGKIKPSYALEYFSEGIMHYYKDRNLLKKKDEELYNFIKEMINK